MLKFLKRRNIIAVRMEELTGGGKNASLIGRVTGSGLYMRQSEIQGDHNERFFIRKERGVASSLLIHGCAFK